jgi:hypothetical protein
MSHKRSTIYQDLLRDYKELSAIENRTEQQEQELKGVVDMLMVYWFPYKHGPVVITTTVA